MSMQRASVKLRERRATLGLRREDVAAKAGVSVATVIRAETAKGITQDNLWRIADALDATWELCPVTRL